MNKALVIGGDRIHGIKNVLEAHGLSKISHWTGRKSGDGRKDIPKNVDLIILVTDWVNHSFTARIKNVAAKRGLNIIYTTNSAHHLRSVLEKRSAITLEDICRKAYEHLLLVLKKYKSYF